MTPDRVDRRTLNRTLLARQRLHPRADASPADVVTHLVGLQAQDPKAPYVGLWSRLERLDPAAAGAALEDRTLVRMTTLRGTVHLHTAADALAVRAWTDPVLRNSVRTTRKRAWEACDHTALAARARDLLADGPLTAAELGAALAPGFVDVDAADLALVARAVVPLAQVPPRGVWGRSGAARHAVADTWLGTVMPTPDPAALVARYLAAFGPASVRDVQTWSGLTRLSEVTATMDLRHYVDDVGTPLLDLPDLPLVDPGTPVPPLFVAPYDNLTLSHADRSRVIDDEGRRRISSANAVIPGLVLLDGFVAGSWRVERTTLRITPFRPLGRRATASLTRPGLRLLRFLLGPQSPAGEPPCHHDVSVAS